MAKILGGYFTSHVPAIGNAIAENKWQDPYWKPFFDGFPPIRKWLGETRPDVAIVFYNDHGLNFFLNSLPTFAIGSAESYDSADEGWGLPIVNTFEGHPALANHIIETVVGEEFDITMCQEMVFDHAVTNPMQLAYPDVDKWPVKVIPVAINTVRHPLPSPKRCLALGRAVNKALASWEGNEKVVIMGTGGLSHQLEGQRAGHINKEYDRFCLDNLAGNPEALTKHSSIDIAELAGSQGVEILNWIAARGALGDDKALTELVRNYHIPISNTAAASMVLQRAA